MPFGDLHTWVDAAGASHGLNGPNVAVKVGRRGLFMPFMEQVDEPVPLQPGSRYRRTATRPREVDLPLLIQEASQAALRATVRQMLSWFDPDRGQGELRVTDPGGGVRLLRCRYVGAGLGIEETNENGGPLWQEAVVTLRANDPYWYASADSTQVLTIGGAAAAVSNTGDVPAPLVWTATGPGNALVLTNHTTGEVFRLEYVISSGEVVTIDTRLGSKGVTSSLGANLLAQVTGDSSFWWLAPGANSVEADLAGTSGASAISAAWRHRYLGV